jgi:hypothetical protein
MKRRIAAGLSILAVAAGMGWLLARQPETSAGLQDVRLSRHSERSQPGPVNALAGLRIRLSGSDVTRASSHAVPQIPVTTE